MPRIHGKAGEKAGGSPEAGRGLDVGDRLVVERTAEGCRFRVKVQPSARKNAIVALHGGALKLTVTAPPERGKANGAVESLIAAALGIPAGRVKIASGHASRSKSVRVEGLGPERAGEILSKAVP